LPDAVSFQKPRKDDLPQMLHHGNWSGLEIAPSISAASTEPEKHTAVRKRHLTALVKRDKGKERDME
jgi:hypothetical protein